MDELDRRIIIELQSNSRQSNRQLARSLGIAEATVRRRIDRLISSGSLILTVLPNLKMFGYSTRAYIALLVNLSKSPEIVEQLCRSPYLRAVCMCTGFADILVRGDFTSVEALADFITGYLRRINGILRIDTMIELRELKRTFFRLEIPHPPRTKAFQTGDIAISEADRRLILQLQKDARAPLKELARDVGVSETTIHRRIKELVGSGAIEFTAIPPDLAKIGYSSRCLVGIETKISKLSDVAESITQNPHVHCAGLFSGPIQILASVYASSPEAVSDIASRELGKIKGIVRVSSLLIVKVLKRTFTWLQ